MSPRLDASMDRRGAFSALLAAIAVVMGLGALPETTNAQEVPPLYRTLPDGTIEPTNSWLLAFEASAIGKNDAGALQLLSDALAIQQHYGVDGLKRATREMSRLGRSIRQ